MTPDSMELWWVELPLGAAWRAASGDLSVRPTIVIALHGGGETGWGECPALPDPAYDGEDLETAWAALGSSPSGVPTAADVEHRSARGGLELARSDLGARIEGSRLRDHPALRIGGEITDVAAGVVVDDAGDVDETLDAVRLHVEAGYRRVKLKIAPGHDLEWCAAVRAAWPDLCLGVDANGAYATDDREVLRRLDALGLDFIEQPYPADRLAELADLAAELDTPVCLDESIRSAADLAAVIEARAADLVSLKWARLGGLVAAAELATVAADAGLGAMVGGMIESGIGRIAASLLAAHPAMTVPGDLSGHDRFFPLDLVTPPVVQRSGRIALPSGPGLGATVDREVLDAHTTRHLHLPARPLDSGG